MGDWTVWTVVVVLLVCALKGVDVSASAASDATFLWDGRALPCRRAGVCPVRPPVRLLCVPGLAVVCVLANAMEVLQSASPVRVRRVSASERGVSGAPAGVSRCGGCYTRYSPCVWSGNAGGALRYPDRGPPRGLHRGRGDGRVHCVCGDVCIFMVCVAVRCARVSSRVLKGSRVEGRGSGRMVGGGLVGPFSCNKQAVYARRRTSPSVYLVLCVPPSSSSPRSAGE